MPTEAEWEYAASRAAPKDVSEVAWYELNAGGETHPVGEKAASGWGLHDLFGNVREWVQDWYAADYYAMAPGTDPKGPASGSYKVYRGCTWLSEAKYCRASHRGFDFPSQGYYSVGFRLVRTPK